jgi:uncharacterized protein (TIGR02147 family)
MKPIFDYLNYREFLHDYYEEKKREHSFYSYRLFSQKAGFNSPNFLKLIIDGKRNLSKESVFKFISAIRLNKKEADYFEHLVFFNQSESLDEKNHYLGRVMRHRKQSTARQIEESEFEYYSAWYHPVIRELAAGVDFADDFKRLGQMVVPPITAQQAEKSVRLLLDLKFIRKEADGRYVKTAATLTTGPQVRSVAVANYHKAMMRLAAESIERFDASQRDVTSLTLNISESTRQAMIARIAALRKELMDMAAVDSRSEKVVQVNFQLFPLSLAFGEGDAP